MEFKNNVLLSTVLGACVSFGVSAEQIANGLTANIGITSWSDSATNQKGKIRDNNTFFEMAGFSLYDWGDLVGVVDLESLDDSDVSNTTIIIVGQKNIGVSDFNLYGQVFKTVNNSADMKAEETNAYLGFSWDKHYRDTTYYQVAIGANLLQSDIEVYDTVVSDYYGYDGLYVYTSIFEPLTKDFSISWFNETFINRQNSNEKNGVHGEVTFSWHISKTVRLGATYVYCNDAMGMEGFTNAAKFKVSYIF